MKRLIAVLMAAVLALPVMPGMAEDALLADPACVTPDDTCKESVSLGSAGQYTFWYYRSYSLATPNTNITRAVIVMHGMERNASDYFGWATTALQNTSDPSLVVIAPHFKGNVMSSTTCQDPLVDSTELHWSCTGSGSKYRWDDGGQARDISEQIFSFDLIDLLVGVLSDTTVFPSLTKIYISGHSDGAQFTQRYAAGNQIDAGLQAPTALARRATNTSASTTPTKRMISVRPSSARPASPKAVQVTTAPVGVPIKYVIANPGSYMYIDNQRLQKDATCSDNGTCTGNFTPDWDPSGACLETYNTYKYGLDGRTYGYMDSSRPGLSDPEVAQRFTSRTVVYLMGELDQTSASMFDMSCAANAQGSHLAGDGSGLIGGRRERGTIFWNYMLRIGARNQILRIAANCAHDGQCMYQSPEMVQALSS